MPRPFLRDNELGLAGNRQHAPDALLAWPPERAA